MKMANSFFFEFLHLSRIYQYHFMEFFFKKKNQEPISSNVIWLRVTLQMVLGKERVFVSHFWFFGGFCWRGGVCLFHLRLGSHVSQAGLELQTQSRITLNSWSSDFNLPSIELTGVCYHIEFQGLTSMTFILEEIQPFTLPIASSCRFAYLLLASFNFCFCSLNPL